jgi:hypothetical protein
MNERRNTLRRAEARLSDASDAIPSANGFVLKVHTWAGGDFTLSAAWTAPFFALIDNTAMPEDEPLLYHARSVADALWMINADPNGSAWILDADFAEVMTGPKNINSSFGATTP